MFFKKKIIRFICLFLSVFIFSFAVVSDYSSTICYAYTKDEYDQATDDAAKLGIILLQLLSVGSVVISGGGTLPLATAILSSGITLAEFATDNGDGTFSISDEMLTYLENAYIEDMKKNGHFYGDFTNNPHIYFTRVYNFASGYTEKFDTRDFSTTKRMCLVLNYLDGKQYSQTYAEYNQYYGYSFVSDPNKTNWFSEYTDSSNPNYYQKCISWGANIPIFINSEGTQEYFDTVVCDYLKNGDYSKCSNLETRPQIVEPIKRVLPIVSGRYVVRVYDEPEEPSTEEPSTEEPSTEEPSTEEPSIPIDDEPITPRQTKSFWNSVLDKLDEIISQLKQIKLFTGLNLVWDVLSDLFSGVSNIASTLVTRFPFSIPWDIVLIFKVLRAPPETPSYTIPIKFHLGDIYYDYSLQINLEDFDKLALFSRFLLTVSLIMGLLSLTRKIVGDMS